MIGLRSLCSTEKLVLGGYKSTKSGTSFIVKQHRGGTGMGCANFQRVPRKGSVLTLWIPFIMQCFPKLFY